MLPKSAVSAHSRSVQGEAWAVRLIRITFSKSSSNWMSRFGGMSLVLNFSHQERSKNEAICEHITTPGLLLLINTELTPLKSRSAKAVVRRIRPLDTVRDLLD